MRLFLRQLDSYQIVWLVGSLAIPRLSLEWVSRWTFQVTLYTLMAQAIIIHRQELSHLRYNLPTLALLPNRTFLGQVKAIMLLSTLQTLIIHQAELANDKLIFRLTSLSQPWINPNDEVDSLFHSSSPYLHACSRLLSPLKNGYVGRNKLQFISDLIYKDEFVNILALCISKNIY